MDPTLRARLAALGVDEAMVAARERLDGERARRFLRDLPGRVDDWCERWGLVEPRVLPGGVLSAALACRRRADGMRVVLKLQSPEAASARAEAAALEAWNGEGACRLLAAGADAQALLLEAISPGTAVRPGEEAADCRAAGELLLMLHRVRGEAIPVDIPDAGAELAWRFERAHTMLGAATHAADLVSHADIDRAWADARALHASASSRVMCHGDFLNKNLLIGAGGAWRAIDPRPCTGDRCLDAAFWALAHRPGEDVARRCRRVATAAACDPDRVWAWARAFAVSEAVLVTDRVRALAHHGVAPAAR